MNPAFIAKLDHARGLCAFPWRIVSGYRSKAHNTKIKGAKASSHLKGEAADIACTDVSERFLIVAAAIAAGFKSVEICSRHVHLDHRMDKFRMWIDLSR